MYRVARGICSWTDALGDGSVRVYGEPAYVAALPDWFVPGQEHLGPPTQTDVSLPMPASSGRPHVG